MAEVLSVGWTGASSIAGVLADFDPVRDAVPVALLPPSDRFVLSAAAELLREADAGYDNFRLRPVLTVRPGERERVEQPRGSWWCPKSSGRVGPRHTQ
jgi:hypothetical protein